MGKNIYIYIYILLLSWTGFPSDGAGSSDRPT